MKPRETLAQYLPLSDCEAALQCGLQAFLDQSARNTQTVYDEIYVDAACAYCFRQSQMKQPIGLDVVLTILAFPAIDMLQAEALPASLRHQIDEMLPQIESLNFNTSLGQLVNNAYLPAPVRDAVLFLGTVDYAGDLMDIPTLHRSMILAFQRDMSGRPARMWADISRRIAEEEPQKPPLKPRLH